MPSTAASSSVTHSTPEARSPASASRSSPKWKSTNALTTNISIAGTASNERSSARRSLRISAATVVLTPAPAPGRPSARAAARVVADSTRVRARAQQRRDELDALRASRFA